MVWIHVLNARRHKKWFHGDRQDRKALHLLVLNARRHKKWFHAAPIFVPVASVMCSTPVGIRSGFILVSAFQVSGSKGSAQRP